MPYRDPAKQKEAQKRLKKRNQIFVNNYKMMKGCYKCDEKDSIVLDLHHLDPNEKDSCISSMVGGQASLERIEAELEKCVVICVRCHRILHKGHNT